MTPDGTKPTKNKRYYDVFTWLVTQLTFAFVTTPFILLNIGDSILVWRRVYFYIVIGTAACNIFLMSPGKAWLSKRVKQRTGRPSLSRNNSQDSHKGALLGVPDDPNKDINEVVDEVMEEMKKRRGSKPGPQGSELRQMVEDALHNQKQAGVKVNGKSL